MEPVGGSNFFGVSPIVSTSEDTADAFIFFILVRIFHLVLAILKLMKAA